MTGLLAKEHSILEKGLMAYQPFGMTPSGEKVRDVSGITVKANVDCLEDTMRRRDGAEAARKSVEILCELLNDRIRDRAYHVTPGFLKNVWNSYSYEFVMFLAEFCQELSGDAHFQTHMGERQLISPIIQTLGRPFSVSQIYRMFPHFGQKFAKGSLQFGVGEVSNRSAILRMKCTEAVYQQFGPYKKRCAEMICQSSKAALGSVPARVHHLRPATVKDLSCVANGDEYCEWEFTWTPRSAMYLLWWLGSLVTGGLAYTYLHLRAPMLSLPEQLFFALAPASLIWLVYLVRHHGSLVQEQVDFVEARHEELRDAYLKQEHTMVELKRKVQQLTTLHQAGLIFGSSLEPEAVVNHVLATLLRELRYDRAMIASYDSQRGVTHGAHILGVSDDIAAFAQSLEVPITMGTIEGQVILKGEPVLLPDITPFLNQLHPLNRELALRTKAKSVLSVPLRIKNRIIGALTVDRLREHSLSDDDLHLLVTLASQVAIALENAVAYQEIEALNLSLEAKVHERTMALEQCNLELETANKRLQEVDRTRSMFLSHVSHELRTPLTAMRSLIENVQQGLLGALTERQEHYLTRIRFNTDRLIRMISNLLDRSRIEAGTIDLTVTDVNFTKLTNDVLEELRPLANGKSQRLEFESKEAELNLRGDWDRLNQILMNLVDNAIKYTPTGGRITVGLGRTESGHVLTWIRDTGEGIPPDALPHLFDPFFRVSEVGGSKVPGLGLGLSIVKTLVELHGGTIAVKSEVGKGTEFHLILPLPAVAKSCTSQIVPITKNVLVVDDDPDICHSLVDRLSAAGYSAEAVSLAEEALAKLQTQQFHGLLLDINLVGPTGLEVLRQIRKHNSRIPIVMMTASANSQSAKDAMLMGAQGYVLKPFESARLKEVIEQCFGPAA